ncbi:YceD family protein [Leptospira interrogans]
MTIELDWTHALTQIPEDGLTLRRSATPAQRAEIAKELEISACSRLDVRYEIRPLSHGRYLLTGTMVADVTQSCVVSLEPVESHIEEPLEIEFRPGAQSEADFDALDARDIEPLGDTIVVGRIVYELLSSALDPYPRKEGVDLDPSLGGSDDAEARNNPFAVLKNMKPKG